MTQPFPGAGHVYLVNFGPWRTQLSFASDTSLTYTGIRPDGSHGPSETVTIAATYLRDGLFMVTWQEADKTTVVHVEDFENSMIRTNITGPDLKFSQYTGTMTQIS